MPAKKAEGKDHLGTFTQPLKNRRDMVIGRLSPVQANKLVDEQGSNESPENVFNIIHFSPF